MASAPVKRSHGQDRLDEHAQRRRRRKERAREEGSEHRSHGHSRSKKKKRSRSGNGDERRGGPLRVRSVSELASLVECGAIRVPKNLEHYIEDSTQLLDQVFTILSPDDIKGMLPDILKELRMKQVKQLCLEQLRGMTCEELQFAIRGKESEKDTHLDSPLMQLLGHQAKDLGGTHTPSSVETENNLKEHSKEHSLATGEDGSATTHQSPPPAGSRPEGESGEDEIVIHVSDVSDDNSFSMVPDPKEDASKQYAREEDSQMQQEDRDTIDPTTITPAAMDCSEGSPPRDSSSAADDLHYCASGSSSEDGDGLASAEDISLLLEIEFRKRALESMMMKKKPPLQQDTDEGGDSMEDQTEVQDNSEYSMTHGAAPAMQTDPAVSQPVSVWLSPTLEGPVDPGTMLETDLREKALQSMLAKRKLRQNTS